MCIHKKKLALSLILTTLLFLSGCGSENNSVGEKPFTKTYLSEINDVNETKSLDKISKIELELDSTLSDMLDTGLSVNKKVNYQKPFNLLSVKIVNNVINLYFDEILLPKDSVREDITGPIYATAYFIAEKNQIDNPEVRIYIDSKLLDDIFDEETKILKETNPQPLPKTSKKTLKTSSKKVIINSGHGFTRNENGWGWQRPLMAGVYREDIANAEMGMILASKLEASGILYESVRELNKNAGIGVSGLEKWKENARQYMIAHNLPKSLWQSKNDGYINNDIRSRPYFANYKNGDVLISLHTNAAGATARGTQIYISDRNDQIVESTKLANILKKHLKDEIHLRYDSKWAVNGPYKKNHGENRIANMPSVIIELGFHTNSKDREALSNDTFRNTTMEAIKNALKEYLNVSSIIKGEFDGAGSLVSPTEDCWGCNKDNAVMQAHEGTGSTVVFQWAYNSNTCSQLELTSTAPIDVAIKSKDWNNEKPNEAFTVKLGSSPITLRSNQQWTTFAVTSLKSLNSATTIEARCADSSRPYYNGNRSDIPKDLVVIRHPYFWTGTGSVISSATQISGYGRDKDTAISSSQVNAVTSFQWDSKNCRKLRLTDGTTGNYGEATVSIKGWSETNDHYVRKCNALPCTIEETQGYFILEVNSAKNAISSGQIEANCI